jgi:hypothetical protein
MFGLRSAPSGIDRKPNRLPRREIRVLPQRSWRRRRPLAQLPTPLLGLGADPEQAMAQLRFAWDPSVSAATEFTPARDDEHSSMLGRARRPHCHGESSSPPGDRPDCWDSSDPGARVASADALGSLRKHSFGRDTPEVFLCSTGATSKPPPSRRRGPARAAFQQSIERASSVAAPSPSPKMSASMLAPFAAAPTAEASRASPSCCAGANLSARSRVAGAGLRSKRSARWNQH